MAALMNRPRPFVAEPGRIHRLLPPVVDPSLPSDHATVAFAVTAGLWELGPAWRLPLGILAALIGVARVFVGVHWPTDVIAGAILETSVAWGLRAAAPRLDAATNRLLEALGPSGRDAPEPGSAAGGRGLPP